MYSPRIHVWLRNDGSNTETTGVGEDLRSQRIRIIVGVKTVDNNKKD